ncbi:dihydrofolate reductase [Bacillus marinisedimentorum]|uniref:dihydrofolate reductase n=1 Tax=Bacillus marinisedimentorum TaxID=1821260 RepID=UPI0008729883|nr:dihydrofolate reductase [Bacillus marinisedimentorum]
MISFLVALDRNHTIGKDNDLPWHLPEDLRYFKNVTMDHPIVMGRKTHESIGKILPGRENIIVTRNREYECGECTIAHSAGEVLEMERKSGDEYFVIGGAELFNSFFPYADRLYITYIEEFFEGDTFFPDYDKNDWSLLSEEKGIKNEKNPYDYYFRVYEKKRNEEH